MVPDETEERYDPGELDDGYYALIDAYERARRPPGEPPLPETLNGLLRQLIQELREIRGVLFQHPLSQSFTVTPPGYQPIRTFPPFYGSGGPHQ